MRIPRVATAAILGLIVALVPGVAAHAATGVEDQSTVWIYGQSYNQMGGFCMSEQVKKSPPILQFRQDSGDWVTAAKGKLKRAPKCLEGSGGEYGYRPWFTFTVDELGQPVGDGEFLLQARIVLNLGKGTKYPFTKTVYQSRQAHANALGNALEDLLGLG